MGWDLRAGSDTIGLCFVWPLMFCTLVMFHWPDALALGSEPELWTLWVCVAGRRMRRRAGALADTLRLKYTVSGFPPWAEAQPR